MRILVERRKTFETRNNLYCLWVPVREAGCTVVVARWMDQTETRKQTDDEVTLLEEAR